MEHLAISMQTDDQISINNSYTGVINNYGCIEATGVNAINNLTGHHVNV